MSIAVDSSSGVTTTRPGRGLRAGVAVATDDGVRLGDRDGRQDQRQLIVVSGLPQPEGTVVAPEESSDGGVVEDPSFDHAAGLP